MGKFRHHSYFQKHHRTHSYLFPHVCFECRNAFKKTDSEAMRTCPDCGTPMIQLSRKFKAPKKNDVPSWAVVEYVVQAGFRYQSIQTEDGRFVKYPSTLKEAAAFVLTYKIHTRPHKN
jgi:predicted RNA-binding Zn-ribbon protein involved in translation (DUF1610 family)